MLPRCSVPPLPHSGGAREKQNGPQKEVKLTDSCHSWAPCTHMNLLHVGSKACDVGGDGFLKTTSSDVCIKMTAAGRKAQGESRVGRATHQLRVDRCFYLRLDLPEVPGLVLELSLNSCVLLKIKQK